MSASNAPPRGFLASLPFYRKLLLFFAVFDTVLGPGSLVFPSAYFSIMHTTETALSSGLMQRTAVIWTVFAAVEWYAFVRPRAAAAIALVAAFRFMDIPADLVYFLSAKDLSTIGGPVLIIAVLANTTGGLVFWRASRAQARQAAAPAAHPPKDAGTA